MHTAKLRTVGGSTMVAIPPVLLEALKLAPKAEVSMRIEGGMIVIEPKVRRRGRIGLKARLALCDPNAPLPPEVAADIEAWMNLVPVGQEKV